MPSPTVLFEGVTPANSRAALTALYHSRPQPERLLMPCAGRFAALVALRASGAPAEIVEASDIGLFSSIIGYLSDPRLGLDALPATEHVPEWVDGAVDDFERGAGWMLAMKHEQIPVKGLFALDQRDALYRERFAIRSLLADDLRETARVLGPIRYAIADLRDVVDDVLETPVPTFITANAPWFTGGFTKQFANPEDLFGFRGTHDGELASEEVPVVLGRLAGHEHVYATSIQQCQRGQDPPPLPEGWYRVAADQDRRHVRYLVATVDAAGPVIAQKQDGGPTKRFPIFDDHEITAASQLRIIPTDEQTCLYYRDLFAHRLGATHSETYWLALIDGRVFSAIGVHVADFNQGRSRFPYLTFGVTRSSRRYSKLGKLALLALTSGEFKRLFIRLWCGNTFDDPKGLRTAVIGPYREGKTERGILRRIRVDEQDNGQFKVQYRGEFRDDYLGDVLSTWLQRWGDDAR
jgi:hypothetical protein